MSHGQEIRIRSRTVGLDLVPSLTTRLGVPVWVTGPDGKVRFVNERAEILLGVSVSECLGKPCYTVVFGTDFTGEPFCKPDCPLMCLVRIGSRQIEPIKLGIAGFTQNVRWVDVLAIPVTGSYGTNTALVHCALDANKSRRIETYLSRLISRRSRAGGVGQVPRGPQLTGREAEILGLLAANETPRSIAERLYLSHATVRNHIQHILSKLGVHSTRAAVAYYLLGREWRD